jgi:hypothetical protein
MEHLIQSDDRSKTLPPKQGIFFRKKDTSPFLIQPKLTINQPNDIYEQEADAMADKVMRRTDSEEIPQPFFRPKIFSLQRKCAHCEEENNRMQPKDRNGKEAPKNKKLESERGIGNPKPLFNFNIRNSKDSLLIPANNRCSHLDGEPDLMKQGGGSTSTTPCPTSVTLGALAAFNHSDLPAAQKDIWGTYLGVTSQMNVGPAPDHSGHCMKETLTTISNNCPEQVDNRGGTSTSPCSGNKCLDINRYGSAGDSATGSTLSDGPTAFIDLHRTRFRTSLLEGSGARSCTVVCQQIYSCDRTHPATGIFRITRNFQADTHTKEDGSTVPITTGNIRKEAITATP